MQVATQSALVAGGGSGIGASVAQHLAGLGAKVAVLDVNLEGAEAVARECGGRAFACDIASAESAAQAIAAAREAHGPARILVNCAGILSPGRILGKDGPLPLDAFQRVIEVNLIGAFNLLRLAAADMAPLAPLADGERGVIINTSSIAAYEGQIGQIAYAASKAGMAGMTLPAARDLARHGIRVLSVAPGLVATPMLTSLPQEMQDALAQSIPFPQRLADSKEVAHLVQHMVENVMLNGEVIRLDGALRMPPR
ncbi:SDR family NAD(P)-dependent oxidoreductase [Dongia deserti]|uniref:SDR family NAD(P)-dependent oxidoreductase n=1 Tax=Dongia deserti TaxID=2268030 RepID=UPI000E646125|nr:SDR family NAD(P)-dependent oxidoreductase [Dongia deserti]